MQQVSTGQTVPASFGDYLWRGDVIMTGQEAQAEAICSDGVSIQIDPNQSLTVACGEIPDPFYQDLIPKIHDGQIEFLLSTRPVSSNEAHPPFLLSPRNTHLIEKRPTIRWQPVEGAESYEVVVSGPKGELWRATTQTLELPYPEAQPALEAGISYLIQVIARLESAEQSETVLVTVLSADEEAQVRQVEAQVERLGLSTESTRFFLAAYYADQELYQAALAELEPLAETAPSPLTQRLLGDVYLAIVLDDQAAQHYEAARRLAQEQSNRLVQAEAEVGLGHEAFAAKAFKQALSHYQAALKLYQELELEQHIETVTEFVADAEVRVPPP